MGHQNLRAHRHLRRPHPLRHAVVLRRALAATAFMYNYVPTAFIPQEDQSYFLIIVQTPPGASLSYTTEFADRVSDVVRKNDGVFGTFSVMGFSLSGGSSPNSGLIFAPLKPINDRTKMGDQYTARNIVRDVGPKLFGVPGGVAFAAEPPAVAGLGTVGGFQFILQDGGRNTFDDIARVAHTLVAQGNAPGSGLTAMNTQFTSNDPQLQVTVDRQKAETIGVPFSQITAALGTFMGSSYVNDFNFNNRSLPRLRSGRRAVSQERAGSSPVLRPLEQWFDDPARQPRHP